MIALGDKILIRVKPPEDKIVNGIITPASTEKKNYFEGTVESVGEELNQDLQGKKIYFSPNRMLMSLSDNDDVLCVIKAENALLQE